MERFVFDTYEELADFMLALISEGESSVSAALPRDDAAELIRELLLYKEIVVGHIDIDSDDDNYKKEFYVEVDDNYIVNVYPVCDDNNVYMELNTGIVFIHGDVNSKIINHINSHEKVELVIGEYDDTEEDAPDCGCCASDCTECPNHQLVEAALGFYELVDYILNHRE